jgi:hypothetical protein
MISPTSIDSPPSATLNNGLVVYELTGAQSSERSCGRGARKDGGVQGRLIWPLDGSTDWLLLGFGGSGHCRVHINDVLAVREERDEDGGSSIAG